MRGLKSDLVEKTTNNPQKMHEVLRHLSSFTLNTISLSECFHMLKKKKIHFACSQIYSIRAGINFKLAKVQIQQLQLQQLPCLQSNSGSFQRAECTRQKGVCKQNMDGSQCIQSRQHICSQVPLGNVPHMKPSHPLLLMFFEESISSSTLKSKLYAGSY